MEEKTVHFTSEITYDPPFFREYRSMFLDNLTRNIVSRLYLLFFSIFLILNMDKNHFIWLFLILAIFILFMQWHNYRKNRDGGLEYRQLLHQYAGDIPGQLVSFQEDQFVLRNLRTENEITESYQSIRKICESKNLILLITDLKINHVIDKRNMTGGSVGDLIQFLRNKCPKVKRIRRGRFGRFVNRAFLVVIALGLIWSVLSFFHIPEKLSGQITNDMSYEEMAAELAEVGIVIDPATIAELKEYEDAYADPIAFLHSSYPKVMDLLTLEGMGKYDWDTWEWTPSTSGVYWFDTEVMNLDTIYTDFLRGLDAMDEDLSFSNVTEDYTAVDIASGMGIVSFSFDYQGQRYMLNAQYQYDWFDTNMLFHMGRILQQDSDPRELWYTFDGQGVLLYYGTLQEAQTLEQKTGLVLLDPVRNTLYG